MCLFAARGGVGWDYHHGTHTDPLVTLTFPNKKHHSLAEGGPVGGRATECVPVEHKRTVNACKLAPSDFPVEIKSRSRDWEPLVSPGSQWLAVAKCPEEK